MIVTEMCFLAYRGILGLENKLGLPSEHLKKESFRIATKGIFEVSRYICFSGGGSQLITYSD